MRLEENLKRILGNRRCRIFQTSCSDCGSLCTFVRLEPEAEAIFASGCICNYRTMKAMAERETQGWGDYPPPE